MALPNLPMINPLHVRLKQRIFVFMWGVTAVSGSVIEVHTICHAEAPSTAYTRGRSKATVFRTISPFVGSSVVVKSNSRSD